MSWPGELVRRIGMLLRKRRLDAELEEEMRLHLELRQQENLESGAAVDDARRNAILKFGGIEQLKEDCRDARGTQWAESTLQDIRLALRTLRKSPGFTITAILTLALGIGANTAIFQLLDAVRLRSLPVSDPQALATIQIKGGNHGFGINAGSDSNLTYPLWEQIRGHQQGFSQVFAWTNWGFQLGQGTQARDARGLWVSGGMFPALGLIPVKGRLFSVEDDQPGCGTPGVVLSYAFWQSEFGGQESAIGTKLVIEDHSVEVIGVTPPGFFGLEVGRTFDFAVPLCSEAGFHPGDLTKSRRDFFWLTVMGRLKPGRILPQASAEMDALSPGVMEATVPSGYSAQSLNSYRKYRLAVYSAGNGVSELRKTYDTSLWLLLGITGLVLLIACANLANLMLARASTREREMAVRLALGASRWRLIRQLLSEGLVLAAAGATLGVAFAAAFSRSLVWLISTEYNRLQLNLSVDWSVLAFVAAIAILTCAIFGLAPAFRSSRAEPGAALKAGSRGMTAGAERFSFQRMLVVSQIAVSLVLLVGALLFVRSFRNIMTVDPGFREKDILITFVSFEKLKLPPDRYEPFRQGLLEQIRSIPQVESAATSTHVPFNGSWTSGINVDGVEGPSKFTWASPGYFETLQIPLIAGRDFNDRDTSTSPRVAIVSESFIHKFLGGRNPIGKIIRTAPEPNYPAAEYEIVGVVKDTKYADLREEVQPPEAFAPASQFPAKGPWTSALIRSSHPLPTVISALRGKLSEVSPEIVADYDILQKQIENSLMRERAMALLSGFFGALAALLAIIGLYGVISYVVAMRRNEIGIRMALGASRQNIAGIIIRHTLQLLALGIVAGVLLSLVATRGAGSLLFGLQPNDPLTLIAAAVSLVTVALLASYLPAYRASRVDPMKALRYE